MSFTLPSFNVDGEYDLAIHPSASSRIIPVGISSSSFKRAWDLGYTGKDIAVAVIDTGIDASHPDLKDKVIKSFNLTGESLSQSHGTHVAGTIAANGRLIGGAPDAKLIDIKVLGKSGASVAKIVEAINLAIKNQASVINMSLGGKGLSAPDIQNLTNAIQNAWNNGIVCICAAGNDGVSICTPDPYQYPASIVKSESVAACSVGESLNDIKLSTFSNENNMVDLAACGQNVLSTVIGGGYAIYSGTSMATPHVAAMAALLCQYVRKNFPTLKGMPFAAKIASLLDENVMKIEACGVRSISVRGKLLLTTSVTDRCIVSESVQPMDMSSSNISFGKGYLRYDPSKPPVVPFGTKLYNNNIFIGHSVM
jgi:major intracellular serine protease